MLTLEFTTTHVAQRHEVYKRTIDSFVDKLVDVDFDKSSIYINIDSAPDLPHLVDESEKTIEYLDKIFNKVVPNVTGKGSFTEAVEWCWKQPQKDIFFHLEDDWVLEKKVKLEPLFEYFEDENIFAVNLRAYHFPNPRPCLLPALYRKSFCDEFTKKLNYFRNPERQLREFVTVSKKYTNIHYPEDIDEIILKDIGRHWLICQGLKRNQISNKFIKYSKDMANGPKRPSKRS